MSAALVCTAGPSRAACPGSRRGGPPAQRGYNPEAHFYQLLITADTGGRRPQCLHQRKAKRGHQDIPKALYDHVYDYVKETIGERRALLLTSHFCVLQSSPYFSFLTPISVLQSCFYLFSHREYLCIAACTWCPQGAALRACESELRAPLGMNHRSCQVSGCVRCGGGGQ